MRYALIRSDWRRRALASAFASALLATCSGGDGDCPLGTCDVAPTSISIVGPLDFTALDQTMALQATVRNQGGIDITSAVSVLWSSDDPTIVSVSSGTATATGVGEAMIFASVGVLDDEATATVMQVPTQLTTVDADRSGTVGDALAEPLDVTVRDSEDNPISGVAVAFTASAGVLSSDLELSDADGRVSTSWTLGTVATAGGAPSTVEASLPDRSAGPVAEFRATVLAGPAAAFVKVIGDDITWLEGQATGAEIVARVVDIHGNGVPDQIVVFEPRNDGTSVPETVTTELAGTAATGWFMGNGDQDPFNPEARPDTIDVRYQGSSFAALVFTGTVYPHVTGQVFTAFKRERTPHGTDTSTLHTCPDSNVVMVKPDNGMEPKQARILSVAGEDCANPRLFGRPDPGYPNFEQIRYEIPFFGLVLNTTWRFELLIRGVSFGERVGNNKICPESGCFEAYAIIDVTPSTIPANDDHATVFTLDGSRSYHTDADTVNSHAWTLPAGTTLLPDFGLSDPVIQVTFPNRRSYAVTLVVEGGFSDADTTTVSIPIG